MPAENLRHPMDPDERPSSKATAVMVLGIGSLLLMFCVGGAVPAMLGLALARRARAEMEDARGFLTGEGTLRSGVLMCWIALTVSVVVLVIALIIWLLNYGANPDPQFPDNVD